MKSNIKFIDHLHSMYRLTQLSGQSSTSITVDCLRKILEILGEKLDSETINVETITDARAGYSFKKIDSSKPIYHNCQMNGMIYYIE